MDRAQKREMVAFLKDVFTDSASVVVVRNTGLDVSEMTSLRAEMRAAGASLKVAKNRLARLALEGSEIESIGEYLSGPTVLGYSEDPVAAAKVLVKFAKKNEKLEVLGGAMGTTALDLAGVKALAELPSLDELRGKLVGLLQAPAGKLASVTQAPAGQLARVFGAYGSQGEAA
ncbi:50S ribosomal protein L10 [Paremcibacter congregatus]|jgi:large subunit ribosomal protein L10|uniref:Large ribosomal subunit protein uL10 n=1 Tax=Paremcibacter congregatus TaxID=2043170 RepID=A0A2G4YVN8_9PROT|nr:50S ribosomal protein L10 [Paremcibacter congregatus]PHZ85506.1 50S ribosomal protein L10 [Paremcibacter congregatus]QDE28404.1 50S ribosomal protein L10 [Paremcibacter congregatus]|tara:strand:+ start:1482 stop:2000 length:519 start_codon:yes stop_codon:yes gene_type:complete